MQILIILLLTLQPKEEPKVDVAAQGAAGNNGAADGISNEVILGAWH
jgi:hypothetical protein